MPAKQQHIIEAEAVVLTEASQQQYLKALYMLSAYEHNSARVYSEASEAYTIACIKHNCQLSAVAIDDAIKFFCASLYVDYNDAVQSPKNVQTFSASGAYYQKRVITLAEAVLQSTARYTLTNVFVAMNNQREAEAVAILRYGISQLRQLDALRYGISEAEAVARIVPTTRAEAEAKAYYATRINEAIPAYIYHASNIKSDSARARNASIRVVASVFYQEYIRMLDAYMTASEASQPAYQQ